MKKKRIIISMLTLLCSCTGVWAQSASDVLSGVFTINANGVKVQFSKGNLQKIGSNYQFAEHQYDYIGNNQSDNNKDLFPFNGYSTPDVSWFNMSHAQWKYLLATRSVTNSLYAGARYTMATLDGTYKGLIIFPDDYTHPNGTDFVAGTYNDCSNFTANVSLAGWALMEAAGCVFLPAAGYYSHGKSKFGGFGEAVEINTTTSYNDDNFYTPVFKSSTLNYDDKSYKQSWIPVRLVQLKTGLQQDADGYYLIGSVQDWKNFAAIVNNEINTAANARMTADIDLGDDQTYISPTWHGEFSNRHYHGTFDGQGHTLTVHYDSSNMFHTPFSQTSGATIKNLHVAGTIKSTSSEPSHMSGLVSNSAGSDVIQNVWVSADITGGSNAWIECGAFVGCNNCGHTTITDCLFTGSITTKGGTNGCFAGYNQGYQNSTITTNNCLSTGAFNFTSGTVSRGTINNSYVKSYPNSIPADMQVTDAQLSDGTTTTALNNGRTGDDAPWVQQGNQPTLAIFPAVMLTDETDLTALSAYAGKTCKVAYSRSFTNGAASTVCLPFAYTKKEGDGSFYAFMNIEKVNGEYVATMAESESTTLTANTPYLYTPNSNNPVDFSGTYILPDDISASSTTNNGWTFKGTYQTKEWTTAPTGIYGFSAQDVSEQGISQGQFVKVGAYVRIKPMRCYLEKVSSTGARGMSRAADEELPETIKVRLISANGEVTAIGSLQTKTGEVTFDKDPWYSLDGRRFVGKPTVKGIYVNNGKKIVVK